MFAHEFVRNAFLAGSPIALACGVVGYFVVLRAQVFAGDALSHVAFTGALAAAAAGVDTRIGLFASTVVVGLILGALGERAGTADVTVGIMFTWILGLGVLCLALFSAGSGGGNGLVGARSLFGSIFGLSRADAVLAAVIGAGVIAATARRGQAAAVRHRGPRRRRGPRGTGPRSRAAVPGDPRRHGG